MGYSVLSIVLLFVGVAVGHTWFVHYSIIRHHHSNTLSHCCFCKLRWSSGSTKTTRSRSFPSTSSLCVSYASVMLPSLSSVSLSMIDCASCVVPACYSNDVCDRKQSKRRMIVVHTALWKAENSCSFVLRYASISLVASVRASFSRCTLSGRIGWNENRCRCVIAAGNSYIHWRACCTTLAASFSASRRVWILCDCCAAYTRVSVKWRRRAVEERLTI